MRCAVSVQQEAIPAQRKGHLRTRAHVPPGNRHGHELRTRLFHQVAVHRIAGEGEQAVCAGDALVQGVVILRT